jgi:diguanylate cyclase (GGDEF)-like protein
MRWLLAVVVVSAHAAVSGGSPGVTTVAPDESVQEQSLTTVIELLQDSGGELTIADVSKPGAHLGFVAGTPENTNIGFSRSAWWVRFTLRNAESESRLVYLRQSYPLIDYLELYEPEADGWKTHATGDRRPFSSRDVRHKDFLFPVTLPPQSERTFYLRYSSQGPVDINLSLLGASSLAEELSKEQVAYGIYFGCVLMLLVWSGLVFVAVRDKAFLSYFAYVAAFGIYMTVNTGFAFQYFWPDSPRWANSVLIVMLNLAIVAALHFSVTILRSRDYTPTLYRVAQVFQGLGILGMALTPFMSYSSLVRPTAFVALLAVAFMITLGIVSLLAGSRPARFYVTAWGALLVGSVIFLFKNFGLVPHTFMSQHSWQVGALLEMLLLSMTLSSRMNELKHQSRTDPLTLLGNRRLFDDRLPVEFAVARDTRRPLSLRVLDLDNFKAYNDQHGPQAGDEAIKIVGTALRRHARKPVLACRYGGDEFCVILPGTDAETAAAIAERLRASVAAARSGDLTITISVGYASVADAVFESHENLFDAADAALYVAKENGRNRVSEFKGRRVDDLQRRTSKAADAPV